MKRKAKLSRLLLFIIMGVMLFLPLGESALAVPNSKPRTSISSYDPARPKELTADNLYGESAILIDAKTGRILFEKDIHKQLYPASITKVLTAVLTLENMRLGDKTTVSLASTQSEASWIPVRYKEQYTIEQLLHAMMMKSANDAALVLAEAVAGSVSAFAGMMNAKAERLGCLDSNFVTPNGLPNSDHYSTAYDMALIAREAIKNETFRKIITTQKYTLPATEQRDHDVTIENTNRFLYNSGDDFSYEYGIGMKTGYTNAAQHSFIGAAEKNGMLLLCVIMGTTQDGKWLDATKLMEYGFSMYSVVDVAALYEQNPHEVLILGGAEGQTDDGFIELGIKPEDRAKLEGFIDSNESVGSLKANIRNYITYSDRSATGTNAPVAAGDVLATMTFKAPFMDEAVSVELVAKSDVAAKAIATQQPVQTPAATGASALTFAPKPDTPTKTYLVGLLLLIPAGIMAIIAVMMIAASIRRSKKQRQRLANMRRYTDRYDR